MAGLGFNAAHAPAHDAQAVHHGGVRIGAQQRVRVCRAPFGEHYRCQVFQIHLMHDARIGRHHAEITERALSPLQERISLAITLEFQQSVEAESVRRTEAVHLHRMVDDEIRGDKRIGALRVGMNGGKSVAHGREIHHAGDAREILQQHTRRTEVDLLRGSAQGPFRDVFDVGRLHRAPVFEAKQVFEKNANRVRHSPDVRDAALFQRIEPEDAILAPTRLAGWTQRQNCSRLPCSFIVRRYRFM
jgi:hypothetical protein